MATMLDCKKIQPQISEYIDGVLENDATWAIRLHLSSCAVCATVVDELTATTGLLRDLPAREPSPDFEAALAMRLADKVLVPRKPSVLGRLSGWWSQPRTRPAFAAGAAVLAALLPVALVVSNHLNGDADRERQLSEVSPTRQVASGEGAMDDMWREHLSYASSEPLADPSGVLQARSAPVTIAVEHGF